VWHTGRIGGTTESNCLVLGANAGQCQTYEVIEGDGSDIWFELLLTPVIEKVNQEVDSDGDPVATVSILDFSWNGAVDLADGHAAFTWEFDNDTENSYVSLVEDGEVLGLVKGPFGAVSGGDPSPGGYPLFAPMAECSITGSPCVKDSDCLQNFCEGDLSRYCEADWECYGGDEPCHISQTCIWNAPGGNVPYGYSGTAGNNREGMNSCFFNGSTGEAIPIGAQQQIGLAGPPDDDRSNDAKVCHYDETVVCRRDQDCRDAGLLGRCDVTGDGDVDEFLGVNGPWRNMNISWGGGPDLRNERLEDRIGDAGRVFQGALGFLTTQKDWPADPEPQNNFKDSPADPDPLPGFGVTIDDVVLEWREITLIPDGTTCACDDTDVDGDGFSKCTGDCDDDDINSYPGAPELCDGNENNCSGHGVAADELDDDGDDFVECTDWYDSQGDQPQIIDGGDCNDRDPGVFPGSLSDADSDGWFDCDDNCPTDDNGDQSDIDNDGWGDVCDCESDNPASYPGAPEICDGHDNDCSGFVPLEEYDNDSDGYVECSCWICTKGKDSEIIGGGDCDDTNGDIYPDAQEINDGLDNQCPGDWGYGVVDEISGLCSFAAVWANYEFSCPAQMGATGYEFVRSFTPNFNGGCTTFTTSNPDWIDPASPPPGLCYHYLGRALAPNPGSWGQDSTGMERTNICP
jgi:hypothetical protein